MGCRRSFGPTKASRSPRPEKFGVPAQPYVTLTSQYGKQRDYWDGGDISITARPREGVFFQGGVSSGRRVEDNCDVMPKIDSPSTLYCHRVEPLVTLIKGYGSYTIPLVDVQFSATYQSKPGPLVLALYTATNAEVAPGLGRNLAGAAPSIDLHLLSPGIYNQGDNSGSAGEIAGDRLHLGRPAHLEAPALRRRARPGQVDLYNAFNSNAVLLQNDAWDSWQTPEEILLARFFKFSVQFDF